MSAPVVPMAAGDRLRTAGLALGCALGLAVLLRLWVWISSGLMFGPVLGGLTALTASELPGSADWTVPAFALGEAVIATAIVIAVAVPAVRLLRGQAVGTRRWPVLTWTLLGLVALHAVSVLAVLPASGLHPPAVQVAGFVLLSLADAALVEFARRWGTHDS